MPPLCDPGWSNLKLERGLKGVMIGRAGWSNAKPMGPSCPWHGGSGVAWIRTATSWFSPGWWRCPAEGLSGSEAEVTGLGEVDPEAPGSERRGVRIGALALGPHRPAFRSWLHLGQCPRPRFPPCDSRMPPAPWAVVRMK